VTLEPSPESAETAAAGLPAAAPGVPAADPLLRAMWVVALLGTALRVWFVLTVHRPIDFDYSDMHSYIERARQMATPGFHPSIYDWYYPSGTAFFTSLWLRLFGLTHRGWIIAGVIQALFSGAEIPLVYFAARRFFSPRVALGAATLFAFHYLSIG